MSIHIRQEMLFSDSTKTFVSPSFFKVGENIRVSFRAFAGDLSYAHLVMNSKVIKMEKDISSVTEYEGLFDYWTAEFVVEDDVLSYHFEMISSEREICLYGKNGAFCAADSRKCEDMELIAAHYVPDWAQGRVFYQILVDRFFNGDISNDVLPYEYMYIDGNYANAPGCHDTCHFYGGDLQGIIDKLDYLKELGAEGLYLNPVFVSPSSHKYDTQDYDAVDPHIGKIVNDEGDLLDCGDNDNRHATRYICRTTDKENLEASNRLFITLIEEAHARNIKVLMDGVFNHCGSFSRWMDLEGIYGGTGAYKNPDSPYRKWFSFTKSPEKEAEGDVGRENETDEYEGWWDYKTLPKLNYEADPSLTEEILRIAKKWLEPPFNADGWRLDVAADAAHSPEANEALWKAFRKAVKDISPEKLIIAEHYGPSADRLRGDEWDAVMNYDGFMEPVSWFLTGMEKHSDARDDELKGDAEAFFDTMLSHLSDVQAVNGFAMMNELSNHDHSRFLTRTNGVIGRVETCGTKAAEENIDKAIYRQAVVILMTWPGMPTIYYGDEAGLCGFTDPDSRRPYPWGNEDRELLEFHRYIIDIHKKNPVLKTGSVKRVKPLEDVCGLAVYGRFDKGDIILTVVQTGSACCVTLPVCELGAPDGAVLERLMYTNSKGYNVGYVQTAVAGGSVKLFMEEHSAAIWRVRKDKR